jgi:hypothetical protein
VARSQSVCE